MADHADTLGLDQGLCSVPSCSAPAAWTWVAPIDERQAYDDAGELVQDLPAVVLLVPSCTAHGDLVAQLIGDQHGTTPGRTDANLRTLAASLKAEGLDAWLVEHLAPEDAPPTPPRHLKGL